MKKLFKRNKVKEDDNIEESSVDVYFFSLYHKPSKRYILLISDPYPSRDIAHWSAINYYRWLLKDKYNEDDILIALHTGIPEIIDNSIIPKNVNNPITH